MRSMREAPGREGRAWDGNHLRQMQDPERGAVISPIHCDICGAVMVSRQCKIRCPNCGYTRDCSDPVCINS